MRKINLARRPTPLMVWLPSRAYVVDVDVVLQEYLKMPASNSFVSPEVTLPSELRSGVQEM